MKIAKACEEKYNINLGCNTLQLGTFSHYANLDPSFSIADVKEGSLSIKNFSSTNSTHGDFIMSSIDSPYNQKLTLDIKGLNEKGQVLSEPNILFKNCFIFCTSLISETEIYNPRIIGENYNSFYTVENNSINSFSQYIANLLAEQLTHKDLDLDSIGNPPLKYFNSPITIETISAAVKYEETKDPNPSVLQNFDHTEIFKYSSFTKDLRYKADQEYRFLYIIRHPIYGTIPVKTFPKLLNLKPILSLTK